MANLMQSPSFRGAPGLWAITCYFNPMRYHRKVANYRLFRNHLAVPLVAIELGYGGEFELGPGDAEVLIQRRGRDVLDQKERLLNIALQVLPDTCKQVAWLDCDLLFLREDWPEHANRLLEDYPVVQLFNKVYYLPRDAASANLGVAAASFNRPGLAALVEEGRPFRSVYNQDSFNRLPGSASPGHAWAARRTLLDQHGFYDACMVGGGDSAINCAAFGAFDEVIRNHAMNEWQREHYLNWARPFYSSVRATVSFVHGDILHLWHGELRDRRTPQKYRAIQPFNFDPSTDIAIADTGCWQWSTEKPLLHQYVSDYFVMRKEDG